MHKPHLFYIIMMKEGVACNLDSTGARTAFWILLWCYLPVLCAAHAAQLAGSLLIMAEEPSHEKIEEVCSSTICLHPVLIELDLDLDLPSPPNVLHLTSIDLTVTNLLPSPSP